MTTDAVRVDDGLLLDELRRTTRPRVSNLESQNSFICTMYGLPYVDGRSGCEKCLELFRTSTQSAKVNSGTETANQRERSWSKKESAIAADESLSNREVAVLTGRSLIAVISKRHDMRAATRKSATRAIDQAALGRAWNAIQRHNNGEGER